MNQLKTTRIIIICFALAVLVYIGITFEMTPPVQSVPLLDKLPWAFLALSVVLFLVGPKIERAVALGKIAAAKPEEASQPLVQGAIISAAIGESIAFLGLVYWFLTANRSWLFLFAAISLVYLALLYSRVEDLEKLAKGNPWDETPEEKE